MAKNDLAFIVGKGETARAPLARYLPPLPAGVAEEWLAASIPPGAWVLDPFGAAPLMALDAARAGYRVLVAANNPIVANLLETLAAAYPASEYHAALAELAASRRGEERMELHIQSLYSVPCAACSRMIPARTFLWQNPRAPYACIYRCPYCGDEGERPLGEETLEALARLARTDGLHRSRALERVAPLDDPLRADVEEALNCYLPRPLYALFTLINKLDGLATTPIRRRLLAALLISACDEANTLWQYPTARARPRQLTVPPHFRENNLWLSLEEAVADWTSAGPGVPLTVWPVEPPASGGICLYQGRLRDLAPALPTIGTSAVLTALPRPNQAFWTLSALWAGWLWGRQAVQPMKSALARRRYDWNWHAIALHAALSSLTTGIAAGTPVFALEAEAEPAFTAAALVAAAAAGLELRGLALRQGGDLAQIEWRAGGRPPASRRPLETQLRDAARGYLIERNEPAEFGSLAAAALAELAGNGALLPTGGASAGDALGQVQAALRQALGNRAVFLRYGGSEHSLEVGAWWLREPPAAELTASDRVEMAVVRWLQDHPGGTLEELEREICRAFPGALTPARELVATCLASYAEEDPEAPGAWRLRAEDAPALRKADLEEMRGLIAQAGARLGYATSGEMPILWSDADGRPAYAFYPSASAIVARYLLAKPLPAPAACLVFPGGRASLLSFKLQRDPRLKAAGEEGWHFIKFRHLRRVATIPVLTRETWAEQIEIDPPETRATQMDMF